MPSSRASAVISPQQDQKKKRTPGNSMWTPPRDEARDVLNDLVIGVLRHVGTEKLLKYLVDDRGDNRDGDNRDRD